MSPNAHRDLTFERTNRPRQCHSRFILSHKGFLLSSGEAQPGGWCPCHRSLFCISDRHCLKVLGTWWRNLHCTHDVHCHQMTLLSPYKQGDPISSLQQLSLMVGFRVLSTKQSSGQASRSTAYLGRARNMTRDVGEVMQRGDDSQ